jgi:molecular chaperone HtpG
MMQEYEGKSFQNIDDADLELPESEEAEGETADSDGDDAEILPEKEFNQFVGRCVTTLGDRVIEVRASKVLKDNPVRLVSPKDAQNREMHRIYRFVDENYEVPKKIMEVNRRHPLVADLAHLIAEQPDSPFINLSIEQLYESALVQEGLHPNPAEMLPRIQELMQLAAAAQTEKS